MGWDVYPASVSKKDIVAKLVRDYPRSPGYEWSNENQKYELNGHEHGSKCLAHKLIGNELWQVRENQIWYADGRFESKKIIVLDIFEKESGQWANKGMCESMGPYYYGVPLKFLEMAPESNAKWRAQVRKLAAAKKPSRPMIWSAADYGNSEIDYPCYSDADPGL